MLNMVYVWFRINLIERAECGVHLVSYSHCSHFQNKLYQKRVNLIERAESGVRLVSYKSH